VKNNKNEKFNVMKRIKIVVGAIFLAVLFSGCSLTPPKKDPGPITFTFSPSIWKSTDGGENWEVENSGEGKANTTKVNVLSLTINPFDGNNAYFGLRGGGIMETTNGGKSWKFINFQSEKVYGLALDPATGKTLYASAVWKGTGKIFKTTDDGVNWKEIYTAPAGGPLIVSLVVSKKNANVIYATTSDNAVIKSVDAGISWKNIHNAQAPVLKIAQDASNENLIYSVTTSGGLFRSRDAGENFEEITANASKATNSYGSSGGAVLEADPSVADRVYLAGSAGLLVSDDAGENWRALPILNNPQTFPVKALAINPQNPKEIISSAVQATYKSVDGGENWITFQFDNKMSVRTMKYNPSNPSELYLGFTN